MRLAFLFLIPRPNLTECGGLQGNLSLSSFLMCHPYQVASASLLKGILKCPEMPKTAQFISILMNYCFVSLLSLLYHFISLLALGVSLWRNILTSLNFCCLWCFLQNSCYLKKPSRLNFCIEVHVPSMWGLGGRKEPFWLPVGLLRNLAGCEIIRSCLWLMVVCSVLVAVYCIRILGQI